MKKTLLLLAMVVLALPALAAEHPMKTPSGWFDMGNCVFCKNLVADPELLPHCQWETLPTSDGLAFVMAVQPGYMASLKKANAAMEATGAKLHSGELKMTDVKMCGFCQAYGELMMGGVQFETVRGDETEVSFARSSDPKMVEKMHAIAKRNKEEMAILMGGGGADPHAGHKH